MEIKTYISLLRRWSWAIALATLVSGVLGYAISLSIPPVYLASTTFVITRRSGSEFTTDLTVRLTDTYAQLMRTRPVLEEAIANLGLPMTFEDLLDKTQVTIDQNTQLVTLATEDTNPERAAAITTEIVRIVRQRGPSLFGNDRDLSRAGLQVIEATQVETQPIFPNPLRNSLLAAVVGAMLSMGIVFFAYYLDDTIQSVDQTKALTGMPLLAEIAREPWSGVTGPRLNKSDQLSPSAEDYQMLRARIEYGSANQSVRTLLVTSGRQHEGSSTIVANLALSMAHAGRHVILIDSDLRQPMLHTLFRVSNARGLTTALARKEGEQISNHLTPSGVENLQLMTSGPLPANPVEVLESPQLVDLFTELKAHADIVLCDSSPLLTVLDAALLARICDATLVVVRERFTRAAALQQLENQLKWFGVRPLGFVLNGVAPPRGRHYRPRVAKVRSQSPQSKPSHHGPPPLDPQISSGVRSIHTDEPQTIRDVT